MKEGRLEKKRELQRVHCMWQYLYTLFIDTVKRNQGGEHVIEQIEKLAAADQIPPRVAAERLIHQLIVSHNKSIGNN